MVIVAEDDVSEVAILQSGQTMKFVSKAQPVAYFILYPEVCRYSPVWYE